MRSNLELNVRIVESLLDDLARLHSLPQLQLDKALIRNRAESEGISFFTKTLPKVGKAFDKWTRDERGPLLFDGFHPKFLIGLKSIIEKGNGSPDQASAIRGLRQIAYLYYKLEQPLDSSQLQTAVQNFKDVDNELRVLDVPWFDPRFALAKRYISDLITRDKFELLLEKFNPRHGPGAVASGEKGPSKWHLKRVFPLCGAVLDYREMYHLPPFCPIGRDEASKMERELIIDPFPTSKLVAVPKDSRGPRLICEEPLEMQYLQQWIFQVLDSLIEQSRFRSELSMRDQSRNQVLAAEGSYTSLWATLDMKEASDRISLPLVLSLFPSWLSEWLIALRSVRVLLPQGEIFETIKYAPMGSALCFPIESIIFWALARAATVLSGHGNRLPASTVSVFGDDIIVPNGAFETVCEILDQCGLVVNIDKSYHTGLFRESCGFDAYNGFEVTPVRIKKEFPSSWRQGSELSNLVAVSNGLLNREFHLSASLIGEELLYSSPLLNSRSSNGLALDVLSSLKTPSRSCKRLIRRGPRNPTLSSNPSQETPVQGVPFARTRWNPRYSRAEVYSYRIRSLSKPFDEGLLRLRRSVIAPVVESDPALFSHPRDTRVEKGWIPFRNP